MSNEALDQGCKLLVEHLQDVYKDWIGVEQFGDTPNRLVRMYQEFAWTPEKIETELNKAFRTFDQVYDEMLVTKPVEVWTLCPHHLLPCCFHVTIGYVPNGKVLGLSKFARVADILARKPIMQEEYSTELAEEFMKRLKPKGIAIYCSGVHGCMTSRGVRQHSEVITSTIRGVFESEPATRQEFFAICRS